METNDSAKTSQENEAKLSLPISVEWRERLSDMHLKSDIDEALFPLVLTWMVQRSPAYNEHHEISEANDLVAASLLIQRLIKAYAQRHVRAASSSASTSTKKDRRMSLECKENNHQKDEASVTTTTAPAKAKTSFASSMVPTQAASEINPSESSRPMWISDHLEGLGMWNAVRNLQLSPAVFRSLVGLASDLAATLRVMAEQKGDHHSSAGLVPSVAEVATICLEALFGHSNCDENSIHEAGMTRAISGAITLHQVTAHLLDQLSEDSFAFNQDQEPKDSRLQESSSASRRDYEPFAVFLIRTLFVLRHHVMTSVENYFDFEVIFGTQRFPSIQRALCSWPSNAFNESSKADVRSLSWKLTTWWLLFRHGHRNASGSCRGISSSIDRKSRILALSSCFVATCSLGEALRQKTIMQMFASVTNEGSQFDDAPSDDDIIDGGSNMELQSQKVGNKSASEHDNDAALDDILDVVVRTANRLCSFLAWASWEEEGIHALNRNEVEAEVSCIVTHICAHPFMAQHNGGETSHPYLRSSEEGPFLHRFRSAIPNPQFVCCHIESIVDELFRKSLEGLTDASLSSSMRGTLVKIPVEVTPFVNAATADARHEELAYLCPWISKRPLSQDHIIAVVATYNDVSLVDQVKEAVLSRLNEDDDSDGYHSTATTRPPTWTEAMELNEWTISVVSLSVVKPNAKLLTYLKESDMKLNHGDRSCNSLRDVIVPVLNRAIQRIYWETAPARSPATGRGSLLKRSRQEPSPIQIGSNDGQVYVDGEITPDIQICVSVIGFFYHALEAILHEESVRLKITAHEMLVQSENFLRALLVCCYTCVLKAVGNSHKIAVSPRHDGLTIYSLLQTMESSPYTLLKVSESFYRALTQPSSQRNLGSPLVFRLPRILQYRIKRTEVQVMDSVVWASEPGRSREGLVHAIGMLQNATPSLWPLDALESVLPEEMEDLDVACNGSEIKHKPPLVLSPEASFLSYFFRKLLKISYFRIQAICRALDIPPEYPISSQVWVAFRYLLRHHVDLLYDRHVDQLILCTVYGICKIMNLEPEITFSRIIKIYVALRSEELGERSCQRIVRHIRLYTEEVVRSGAVKTATTNPIGNVIDLYNHIFVPKMKMHLLHSRSLKRNKVILANAMSKTKTGSSYSQESMSTYNRLVSSSNHVVIA